MKPPQELNELEELYISQLEAMGDSSMGLKILVECLHATFVGVVNAVLECKQILLEQVSIASTGKPVPGLVVLFYHDVKNIQLMGMDSLTRRRILKLIQGRKSKGTTMEHILPPDKFSDDEDQDNDASEPRNPISLLPAFPKQLRKEISFLVVESLDSDDFAQFEKRREYEREFPIYACGRNLCRFGTWAWFAIVVLDTAFLFDVAKIGPKELLSSSVGTILQDDSKLKIIHNIRNLEDYLHHQFSFEICNVFDTQATDVYIRSRQTGGEYLVKSFPSFLKDHLDLPTSVYFNLLPTIKDETMWLERPLAEAFVIYLIHSVCFLRDLKEAMHRVLLSDLRFLTNVFAKSLRDKPSALSHRIDQQVIPPEVQKLCKAIASNNFSINKLMHKRSIDYA